MEPPEEKSEPTLTASQKTGLVIFLIILLLGVILIGERSAIKSLLLLH